MKIIEWFDEEVWLAGESGQKSADSIAAVVARVERDVADAELPPDSELRRGWIESTIRSERNSRARRRPGLFRQVGDALAGLTILGKDDPILDLAMRTGTVDGEDKTMRYWSATDWLDVLAASARNVADAVEADKELRDTVNPIITVYVLRGAAHLEDLL